jgi:hypothetical protein
LIRHPDGSVTVTYRLEISRGSKGHRRVAEPAPPPERQAIDPATVPRIARMLVLGYHFERLVREGKVKNYAEIARMTGLSRARVTQICDLTLMAPAIQDRLILSMATRDWRVPPTLFAPHGVPPRSGQHADPAQETTSGLQERNRGETTDKRP